jgi:hypothetical protein
VREYIRNRCKQTLQEGGLSLDELKMELSVESVALPDPPHQRLRQLSLDPNYAPRQSKAADQCCGTCLPPARPEPRVDQQRPTF